jgi:hypothetical protein
VAITEPAGNLIRLTVPHFAQYRKNSRAQGRKVIQIFSVDAANPEPIALGRASISDADSHGRAKKHHILKRHGPDSSPMRSVRAVSS